VELSLLIHRQGCEEVAFALFEELGRADLGLEAERGGLDRVGAPVGGVPAAPDEPTLLELVEERHHRRAVDLQQLGERLL
jgi:hypothetical protein